MSADTSQAPARSALADVRGRPLAELAAMSGDAAGETLGRILPKPGQAVPVPVASFQSSL